MRLNYLKMHLDIIEYVVTKLTKIKFIEICRHTALLNLNFQEVQSINLIDCN